NFHDSQFVISYKDAEGNNDEDMVKLAEAFTKKVKFGDLLTVFGDTQNRVILRQVEQEEEPDDNLFKKFGGRRKPKHAESYTAKDFITEMSIMGVEAHMAGVYTEEQFVKDELVEDSGTKSDFGGKSKKNSDSPFESDGPIEISDDDLPF